MKNQQANPSKKRNGKRKAGLSSAKQSGVATKIPLYIVCIGASAGGLNAVCELVSQLSLKLNAALFVVLHLSKAAIGDILAERIKKETTLSCEMATDGASIERGHIYIAPPDSHLLVK